MFDCYVKLIKKKKFTQDARDLRTKVSKNLNLTISDFFPTILTKNIPYIISLVANLY